MRFLIIVPLLFLFGGCAGSPHNAFALKSAEYGQCRSLAKGERIRYKKRLVKYVCEDNYVLYGKPYSVKDKWFFLSGRYDGKRVHPAPATRVEKSYRNICQLKGLYGSGDKEIKAFYFDTKLRSCKPFIWSGEGGFVPFRSVDICEMKCQF